MGKLIQGSLKDINNFIKKGYEPIGTLKFVLNNHRVLLEGCDVMIFVDDAMHTIDIQEEYEAVTFPHLINYMR